MSNDDNNDDESTDSCNTYRDSDTSNGTPCILIVTNTSSGSRYGN